MHPALPNSETYAEQPLYEISTITSHKFIRPNCLVKVSNEFVQNSDTWQKHFGEIVHLGKCDSQMVLAWMLGAYKSVQKNEPVVTTYSVFHGTSTSGQVEMYQGKYCKQNPSQAEDNKPTALSEAATITGRKSPGNDSVWKLRTYLFNLSVLDQGGNKKPEGVTSRLIVGCFI